MQRRDLRRAGICAEDLRGELSHRIYTEEGHRRPKKEKEKEKEGRGGGGRSLGPSPPSASRSRSHSRQPLRRRRTMAQKACLTRAVSVLSCPESSHRSSAAESARSHGGWAPVGSEWGAADSLGSDGGRVAEALGGGGMGGCWRAEVLGEGWMAVGR